MDTFKFAGAVFAFGFVAAVLSDVLSWVHRKVFRRHGAWAVGWIEMPLVAGRASELAPGWEVVGISSDDRIIVKKRV